jgi:hypothetical protein
MNRIVKLCCLVALFLFAFALAPAEIPQAEAYPCIVCSLEQIRECNNYCTSRGCISGDCSGCGTRCICNC